ncbi:MAG: hypothetical protein HZA28_02000 [Candidatus Omnitrophica bacterium]|nr:hypothetical protein [Candidatus Omnitrophota bacterium]
MRSRVLYIFLTVLVIATAGCARLSEPFKVIWGTSTTALENARLSGLRKTYTCSFTECYDAVLSLARTQEEQEVNAKREEEAKNASKEGKETPPGQEVVLEQKPAVEEKFFDVFLKDPRQKHIVVIGIVGNVDTTEVGIFFDEVKPSTIRVEISSLSGTAKRRVAKAVFEALDKRFSPAS